MAQLRHLKENAMRIIYRSRHIAFRLAAGIAEHDTLIARAFILIARCVDTLGDVG